MQGEQFMQIVTRNFIKSNNDRFMNDLLHRSEQC